MIADCRKQLEEYSGQIRDLTPGEYRLIREKRYLNHAKIRDFLPDEIIDSEVTELSETIKTILASSHVKSNKAPVQLLMDEDVFDDEQLAEAEEYMKRLIFSMFYV